jgi:hypothetical protein
MILLYNRNKIINSYRYFTIKNELTKLDFIKNPHQTAQQATLCEMLHTHKNQTNSKVDLIF